MKRNSGLQAPWVWPVEAAHYDRTPQLKPCEVEALRVNIPLLQEGALPWEVIEKCKVPRLLDPLEAVCDHVGLQQKYRSNLKIRMLCDMAARDRSFWGWTEEEWIESIKNGGHEKPTVAAAAYLLCEFNSLHKLGRRNFLFYGVGYRVFGRERLAALFAVVRQMLHQWGFRRRMADVYVPRVLCELLVTNRSPHLEDVTLELLKTVEQRRVSQGRTWCLSVLSRVLASRGIVSAPLARMDKRKGSNPHSTVGVPEKWVPAVEYWHENSTHTLKVRKANYGFLLRVGRWQAAKHPGVEGPEQWDRVAPATASAGWAVGNGLGDCG